MYLKSCLITIALLAGSAGLGLAEEYDVDAETGFRMERYRAPVPSSIPDGKTITTAEAIALQPTAVFIDVLPPVGLGADPLNGKWLISEPRYTIKGATWLPEVGRGHLTDEHKDYFVRNLNRLTQGDTATPLVFFCTADCWQSWNAGKRASLLGYSNIHWYPDGTDGWQENGNTLSPVLPVNFFDDTTPPLFPPEASVFLIDQSGNETAIGKIDFNTSDGENFGIKVEIEGDAFAEQFLSMRPFDCITDTKEWYCYLQYPYKLNNTISSADLLDLEYQLLFVLKSPSDFGIDAWNGLYYKLELTQPQVLVGTALSGDLNVLQSPPAADTRPIDLIEFIDESAARRFPKIIIRP